MAATPGPGASGQAVFEVAGVRIPKLGLGTFGMDGTECAEAVAAALAAGCRHVDTAEMYGNERAVGEGIRASGLSREEIFLTTKVWHENLAPAAMMASAEDSLKRLGVDRVDLYLIHWPSPGVAVPDAVRALCAVHEAGLARAVGVSNFPVRLIEEAVATASVPLAVNQVEYHPYLDQSPVLAALKRHGMGLVAYCPLARGRVLSEPAVTAAAERHGVTPAAVVLAWLIGQERVIAIPKSASPARIRENISALSVSLSPDESAAISALPRPDGRMIDPAFAPDWDRTG